MSHLAEADRVRHGSDTNVTKDPEDWRDFARNWLREHQLPGVVAALVAGPSTRNPAANHRIEFLRVGEPLEQL